MKLSEMVPSSREKRLTFRRVAHTIAAAGTFAEAEEAGAYLAEQLAEADRFNAEKQADRDAGYAEVKAPFREARHAFYTQEGPFRRYLGTVLQQLRAASQDRTQTYRTAYRARSAALDEGLGQATTLFQEFAPYLRTRRRLRSYRARIPLFERIIWMVAHALMLLAVMLKLTQSLSWSAFLQDDLLVFWGGLWLLSLVRWGSAWGFSVYLRRRDAVLFGALRKKYKAFDLVNQQDALTRSLPSISLDLSVLTAPPPPDADAE